MGDTAAPGGHLISYPQPMLVGLFVDLHHVAVPDWIALVQTSGHTVPGRGAGRYAVGPAGGAATPATAHATTTANRRPVTLAELHATVEMFGAVGDGASDDTVALNAALAWSGGSLKPVFAESAAGYAVTYLELQFACQLYGRSVRGTHILALASHEPSLLRIAAGPIVEVVVQDITLDGMGRRNEGQCGFIARARPRPDPKADQNGGLWWSQFTRFNILGFAGHCMVDWGGGYDVDTNGALVSETYSYQLPNQFNTYTACRWFCDATDPAANVLLCLGQTGQMTYLGCQMDGACTTGGYNISIGHEHEVPAGSRLPVAGAGVATPHRHRAQAYIAPYAMNFVGVTCQGIRTPNRRRGVFVERATGVNLTMDFENLANAITLSNAAVTLQVETRNVGSDGAGGGAVLDAEGPFFAATGVLHAQGAYDHLWRLRDGGLFHVRLRGNEGARPANDATSGMHRQARVEADGSVATAYGRYIALNSSTVPITRLLSSLAPGEEVMLYPWEADGFVVLQASDPTPAAPGLSVPGGHAVLRAGDVAVLTRADFPDACWRAVLSRAELTGDGTPPARFAEAGEYCRNARPPEGPGTYTRGWWKRTTGIDPATPAHWSADTARLE